jgi:hypothetical protein
MSAIKLKGSPDMQVIKWHVPYFRGNPNQRYVETINYNEHYLPAYFQCEKEVLE